MSKKQRGNHTLTGALAEVWVDGDKILEFKKVEVKVTANREDVQLDFDVDSKMTGLKGEITMTVQKVYSRYAKRSKHGNKAGMFVAKLLQSLQTPMLSAVSRNAIPLIMCGSTSCH